VRCSPTSGVVSSPHTVLPVCLHCPVLPAWVSGLLLTTPVDISQTFPLPPWKGYGSLWEIGIVEPMLFYAQNAIFSNFFLGWEKHNKNDYYLNRQHFQWFSTPPPRSNPGTATLFRVGALWIWPQNLNLSTWVFSPVIRSLLEAPVSCLPGPGLFAETHPTHSLTLSPDQWTTVCYWPNIYIRLLFSEGKNDSHFEWLGRLYCTKWCHCLLNKWMLIGQRNVVWKQRHLLINAVKFR